jgi:hypothetical protein
VGTALARMGEILVRCTVSFVQCVLWYVVDLVGIGFCGRRLEVFGVLPELQLLVCG